MSQDPGNTDPSQRMGKWMFALAWILALALLTFWFNGKLERQYNPNAEPESVRLARGAEVRLQQNRQGHYVTGGFINGQPVTFLLDTGATNVSVPAHLGEYLGLRPGYAQQVITANGAVRVFSTQIDSLQIGDIQLSQVEAHLNGGMRQDEILLGMSALRQLDFRQQNGWLILTQTR